MQNSLIFVSPNKIKIIEETIPVLSVGECLVRNEMSLISPGTELALFTGTHVGFSDPEITWAKYPLLPGYSTIGEVLDTQGESPLSAGDRVMYYGPHSSHGIINPKSDCWAKIPEEGGESYLFARFAQISSTVPHLAKERKGNVLVFGAGMIGNFCAQLFALDKSRKVFIADLSEKRLSLAKNCGIDEIIKSGDVDPEKAIKKVCAAEGVDIIVEATGVPQLVARSLEIVNPLGTVYLLGSSRGDVNLNVYKHIHRKGVSLVGAHESVVERLEQGKSDNPLQKKLQEMVRLISSGDIKTNGMITHRIRPEQAEEYYNNLLKDRDNYLGVVIDWRGES